jgi:hypothetical protein
MQITSWDVLSTIEFEVDSSLVQWIFLCCLLHAETGMLLLGTHFVFWSFPFASGNMTENSICRFLYTEIAVVFLLHYMWCIDDELSTEEVLCKTVPTKKRGRPRKHVYVEELSEKEEEGEKQVPLSSLKRRMIATEGLGSQSSKRLCKNGSGTSPPSRRSMLHHRADTFNCAGCCPFTITGSHS